MPLKKGSSSASMELSAGDRPEPPRLSVAWEMTVLCKVSPQAPAAARSVPHYEERDRLGLQTPEHAIMLRGWEHEQTEGDYRTSEGVAI